METNVIIKNEKGKAISLKAKYQQNDIVVTKKRRNVKSARGKKVVIHVMNSETYEKFNNIEIDRKSKFYTRIFSRLNELKEKLQVNSNA